MRSFEQMNQFFYPLRDEPDIRPEVVELPSQLIDVRLLLRTFVGKEKAVGFSLRFAPESFDLFFEKEQHRGTEVEGVLVVAMSLWLLDVFRRRFNHQGLYARRASRAAYAAFVIHQLVLVELVLATRQFVWSPEVHYLVTVVLGVAGSFLLAFLRTRLPGVSRVI